MSAPVTLHEAAEVARLRELAGCVYAGPAAVHDLPEHWLDALCAASEGQPFSCADLLPYAGARCAAENSRRPRPYLGCAISRPVDVEAVILTLASIVRTDNGNLHPEINALLADAEEAAAAVAEMHESLRWLLKEARAGLHHVGAVLGAQYVEKDLARCAAIETALRGGDS